METLLALCLAGLFAFRGLDDLVSNAVRQERLSALSFVTPTAVWLAGWAVGLAVPTAITLCMIGLAWVGLAVWVDRENLAVFERKRDRAAAAPDDAYNIKAIRTGGAVATLKVALYRRALLRHSVIGAALLLVIATLAAVF